jgi:hypothetical protein
MLTNQTFQFALDAARTGSLISREGWNGKGLFVFVQVPSEVPAEIVPKMSSLPNAAKALLVGRGGPIRYRNQAAIIHTDNTIESWSPSLSDTMATDWIIHTTGNPGDFTAAPVAETAGTATPLRPAYQQRVVDEAAELETKLNALTAFLASDRSDGIPQAEIYRMNDQAVHMSEYLEVLKERIAAF